MAAEPACRPWQTERGAPDQGRSRRNKYRADCDRTITGTDEQHAQGFGGTSGQNRKCRADCAAGPRFDGEQPHRVVTAAEPPASAASLADTNRPGRIAI